MRPAVPESRSPGRRRVRRRVRVAEALAATLIRVGGIGTIVAVSGVFLFLLLVVEDLFVPAGIGAPRTVALDAPAGEILDVGIDPHRSLVWALGADGFLRAFRVSDGTPLDSIPVGAQPGPRLSAYAREPGGDGVAFGFADGSVRLGRILFRTEYLEADQVAAAVRGLGDGEDAVVGTGVAVRTVAGLFRVQRLALELEEPRAFFDATQPVLGVQRSSWGDDVTVAARDAGGRVGFRRRTRAEDLNTLEVRIGWSRLFEVPLDAGEGPPDHLLLTDLASNLLLCWRSGTVERWRIRDLREPVRAEVADLAPGPAEIRAMEVLLGGSTVVCGRSDGRVTGSFVAPDPTNEVDGTRLVPAHDFDFGPASGPAGGGAVVALASASRQRIFLCGTTDGAVHAAAMTSEARLGTVRIPGGGPVEALAIAPRGDALVAASRGALTVWPFDPGHPEVTIGALLGRVHYERFPEPAYVWQSSSGSEAFEPKFSLVPLIFGTLKATFYALLIAVPLALLAAIATSEFLSARARSRVKPAVELMASLPSVVLGFLAAMVIAPVAERLVPVLLIGLLTVPFAILLAASLWQLLPLAFSLRWQFLRVPLAGVAGLAGLLAAGWLRPWVEAGLFAGDVRLWLDGRAGSGVAAWAVLTLPVSAVLVALLMVRVVQPWLRDRAGSLGPRAAGWIGVGKVVGGYALFVGLAFAAAYLLHAVPTVFGAAPFDLRGGLPVGGFDLSPFGTFDPRNALVVGFAMGFLIIPIIYTIAEDALASVPAHLRAASFGAGATPWQTAIRVVVPTAASGLFSACMVGLGRAVGETMVVLMAAGGTPVTSMNLFSGFRTLSANIATELPEAVRGSTQYRTLFLAALCLFAMTFVVNTIAERVRGRFRARARQL
jgi:phosphate transport system permease protein